MSFSVLVIDDYTAIRDQIAFSLSNLYGIEVLSAGDGRTGLELMQRHRPSIVILDLDMPEMDGLEVLERCKADPATRDIPVVVLTATETVEDIIPRVLLAGATDYLRKPVDSVDLRQYIAARITLSEQANAKRRQSRQLEHDVNNPLTALICFAEFLQEDATASSPNSVKELAREMELAARRLYEILRQILERGVS